MGRDPFLKISGVSFEGKSRDRISIVRAAADLYISHELSTVYLNARTGRDCVIGRTSKKGQQIGHQSRSKKLQ